MSVGASPIPAWSTAWSPRTRLSISEWADRERVLPESSAARGARWRTSDVRYLADVMNCLLEPVVRKVALMKSAQSGGTEAVLNAIGYFIAHDPAPMLLVAPTFQDVERLSKGRLADMLRSTPALRAVVHDRRLPARGDGRSESTVLLKQFGGGFLALGGSNTSNSFAALSVRNAFGDDVDRWPMLDEGDPADLLVNRVRTFHDGRVVFVSTPIMKGGRIDTLYQHSDQRRYFLTCPACGREDYVCWNDTAHFRVAYTENRPESARLECPGCHAKHDEAERRCMVGGGRWKATREAHEPGLVGFHLPGTISTLGNVSLSNIVSGWLSARERGTEALRAFINTTLAEAWEEPDTSISIEPAGGFMSAREAYDTVPMPASLITGAVDVQDDRFELLFCAWGPRDECWVLDHVVLSRDDKDPERRFDPYAAKDWDRLYIALFGVQGSAQKGLLFEHECGIMVPVSTLCVDSGYQTALAYHFSRFNRSVIFCTKGVAELQDGHLIKFSEDSESASRLRRGVNLVLVNTGGSKQRLADRIKDERLHFPVAEWCSEEFFEQLTAEAATPIFNPAGVRVGQKWIKTRPRNEILDLLVLNLAARQIRGTWDLEMVRKNLGLPV